MSRLIDTINKEIPYDFEIGGKSHHKPKGHSGDNFIGYLDIGGFWHTGLLMYRRDGPSEIVRQANLIMDELSNGSRDRSNIIPAKILGRSKSETFICTPYVENIGTATEDRIVHSYTVEEAHRYFRSEEIFRVAMDHMGRDDPLMRGFKDDGEPIAGYMTEPDRRNWSSVYYASKTFYHRMRSNLKKGDIMLARVRGIDLSTDIHFFIPSLDIIEEDNAYSTDQSPAITDDGMVTTRLTEAGEVSDHEGIINLFCSMPDSKNQSNGIGYIRREGPEHCNRLTKVVIDGGKEFIGKLIPFSILRSDLQETGNDIMFATPYEL